MQMCNNVLLIYRNFLPLISIYWPLHYTATMQVLFFKWYGTIIFHVIGSVVAIKQYCFRRFWLTVYWTWREFVKRNSKPGDVTNLNGWCSKNPNCTLHNDRLDLVSFTAVQVLSRQSTLATGGKKKAAMQRTELLEDNIWYRIAYIFMLRCPSVSVYKCLTTVYLKRSVTHHVSLVAMTLHRWGQAFDPSDDQIFTWMKWDCVHAVGFRCTLNKIKWQKWDRTPNYCLSVRNFGI